MSEPATEKPKRRFSQIHLSTAVLLMFAAGGMGWLNSRMHFTEFHPILVYGAADLDLRDGYLERGWPIAFYRVDACLTADEIKSRLTENSKDSLYVAGRGVAVRLSEDEPSMLLLNGFLDIAVGLTVLVLTAFVCEWLIRRREGRKT